MAEGHDTSFAVPKTGTKPELVLPGWHPFKNKLTFGVGLRVERHDNILRFAIAPIHGPERNRLICYGLFAQPQDPLHRAPRLQGNDTVG